MAFVPKSPAQLAAASSDSLSAVYRALPMAMGTLVLLATVIVLALRPIVAEVDLVIWWGLAVGIAILRWYSAASYRRAVPGEDAASHWYWTVVVGALATAVLWGSLAWWLWPDSPFHQAMLVVIIAGVAAGAVTTLSPLRAVAIAFIVIACTPVALRYLLLGDAVSLAMFIVVMVFMVMISVSAWRVNQLMRNSAEADFGRRFAEEELQREALYDPLTNLPNRRFFLERLHQEFSRARRHGRIGALLFLDLDDFKTINDSLGHHIGDLLLQQVAERLRGRFRDEDVAGRLGGDEFVVLLADVVDDPVSRIYEVEKVASQLRELLTEPYSVDEHELFVSVSIGVALFPEDAASHQDVLKHADTAMYRAKAQGRNNYQFFLPGMQEEASQRLLIEKDLRLALRRGELDLHYQRQVDAQGRVVGLEALARWQHPQKGAISPGVFVPIADESMLVHELHDWVVRRVCADIRRMIDECGYERVPVVSINVSARAFHHASFEQQLLEQITSAGVPPEKLCLEITETSVMERVEMVIDKMLALRRSGVVFSVDDFGTGYSSLAYLKRLPVASLKIDRAFVRDITSDANDAIIVETILSMARHLKLESIAEGVEDEAAAQFLRERGCDLFQGWLYGRAEPLDQVIAYLCAQR